MHLEVFVWLWTRFGPGEVVSKCVKGLGLAAIIIVPLVLTNVQLHKYGFRPSRFKAGLSIEVAEPPGTFPATRD
jgi:hypothetical protein